MIEGNRERRILKVDGCPTLQALHTEMAAEQREQREQRHLEFDALNSILRVLEPLTAEQRERCLAAARALYNAEAATLALEGLV